MTPQTETEPVFVPEIQLPSQVFEIAFGKTSNIIASGLIDGSVFLHRYSTKSTKSTSSTDNSDDNDKSNSDDDNSIVDIVQVHKFTHHTGSCRALEFSSDDSVLYTASQDQSLFMIDTKTGKTIFSHSDAHDSPINVLKLIDDNILVSGDDEGVIKAWDIRQKKEIMNLDICEDFISDLSFNV